MPEPQYIVMNPTWKWAVEVHALVLRNNAIGKAQRERVERTIDFMNEMAAHLDRHNNDAQGESKS